jgi:hypothetical protein
MKTARQRHQQGPASIRDGSSTARPHLMYFWLSKSETGPLEGTEQARTTLDPSKIRALLSGRTDCFGMRSEVEGQKQAYTVRRPTG